MLFLVLSFMFLLLTKLTQDYTKTITFAIRPINAVENHVILKDTTHKFDITLSTYGFKFLRYYLAKPEVTVDLNDLENIDNRYTWTNSAGLAHLNSQFSENVKILAVNPESVVFRYDVSGIKMVSVQLNSEVNFAPGYDILNGFKVDPDSIKVIGPKILLDSIKIIQTEIISLSEINSDINRPLNVILPDSSQNVVYSHKKVNIKAQVEKFTEGTVEVPVDLVNVPNDVLVNYFPKTINVMYYTSLSNFKNIKNSDFIVECDFNNLKKESTFLEPRLVKYPENAKNIKLGQKHIEFIISK
ncbi:MAG: YbbR-like domain-containing protein [Arcobacter sp.]|nr:YbbR-like domain-containing protein [Arcobacter sp.]